MDHLKTYVNSTKNHKSYQFSLTICFYLLIFSGDTFLKIEKIVLR